MSNVTVYFGAQPSEGQIVAKELAAKGIELTKLECSKVNVHGHSTTVQPGFAVYKAYLPMFIRMAHKETITDFSNPFGSIPYSDRQISLPLPDLVVSWKYPVGDEVRAQLRDIGFRDDVVKGKPALRISNPSIDAIKAALNHKVNVSAATNEQSVNVFALRRCTMLKNIVSRFLATHQYPAFIDKDHESEFNKAYSSVFYKDTEVPEIMEVDAEDEDREEVTPVLIRRFKVSLPEDVDTIRLEHDEHSAPAGEGLLFPFVKELAKFDRSTVLEVIKRYFYAGLGDTEEECRDEFENLTTAWGNIQNTLFGMQMSHIFKCIDIAMMLQCQVIIMSTINHFDGVYMRGAGYVVSILGKTYTAASAEDVKTSLVLMDRHAQALWMILGDIELPDEETKKARWENMKSIKELKVMLESLAVKGGVGVRDRILRNAKDLSFPEDRYWQPTAVNIAEALSFISDPLKDITRLPTIHHTKLFATDRVEIVWSAFGGTAPSFRVPQGKEMFLNKSFKVSSPKLRQERGSNAARDVSKIGAIMLELDMATTHMKQTFELKTVLNPFGNAIVNASSSHANKVFEKESCDIILTELRKAAKVTVVDAVGGGAKRGRDDDEEASHGAGKKQKFAF